MCNKETRAAGALSVRESVRAQSPPPRYYFITRPIRDALLLLYKKQKY